MNVLMAFVRRIVIVKTPSEVSVAFVWMVFLEMEEFVWVRKFTVFFLICYFLDLNY